MQSFLNYLTDISSPAAMAAGTLLALLPLIACLLPQRNGNNKKKGKQKTEEMRKTKETDKYSRHFERCELNELMGYNFISIRHTAQPVPQADTAQADTTQADMTQESKTTEETAKPPVQQGVKPPKTNVRGTGAQKPPQPPENKPHDNGKDSNGKKQETKPDPKPAPTPDPKPAPTPDPKPTSDPEPEHDNSIPVVNEDDIPQDEAYTIYDTPVLEQFDWLEQSDEEEKELYADRYDRNQLKALLYGGGNKPTASKFNTLDPLEVKLLREMNKQILKFEENKRKAEDDTQSRQKAIDISADMANDINNETL